MSLPLETFLNLLKSSQHCWVSFINPTLFELSLKNLPLISKIIPKIPLKSLPMSLPCSFKLALFFLFFITFVPPKGVGLVWSSSSSRGEREISYVVVDEKKMMIGSRPPGCENKCRSCRPCTAAAVVPEHGRKFAFSRVEEDSYYLLSWKCRCGNNIYQP